MANSWKVLLGIFMCSHISFAAETIWTEWWTYSGISGPRYWGIHNTDWSICNKGKFQSPIDIDPKHLVYDPNMSLINISNNKVDGTFKNNGQDISFELNTTTNQILITGGPLSYKYHLFEIKFHFGHDDKRGSEHSIGGKKFPLEIQLYGYNPETNHNISQAVMTSHGIVAIVILAQAGQIDRQMDRHGDNANFAYIILQKVSHEDNGILDVFVKSALKVKLKGMTLPVFDVHPSLLLPSTQSFVTYDGSFTQPGCMETVTWIVLNKPIHVSHRQMASLRSLTNTDGSGQFLMENNFRSTMPSHGRLIRTNIKSKIKVDDCYGVKLTSYEDDRTEILMLLPFQMEAFL